MSSMMSVKQAANLARLLALILRDQSPLSRDDACLALAYYWKTDEKLPRGQKLQCTFACKEAR